jgi:arylsulfatase A-like enzyme
MDETSVGLYRCLGIAWSSKTHRLSVRPEVVMRITPILLAALTAVALAPPVEGADRKPNIVFILADDLGYTDLACYGSRYYQTPHIDRLAAQGMKFTSGYTCGPNCQPTRAALMSGQYGPRTGVYTVGSIDRFDWRCRPLRPVDNVKNLPLDKITLAQTLKAAGYATAMFGKWHLGQPDEYHPSRRGFDEAIVSMGRHFDFVTTPKVDYPSGTYLADFLTDKAVDFVRRHQDRPFFLYLPHFGVHAPYQAKKDWIAKFKDKPPAGGHHDPSYAAMIASVDESVGRVLALLDELKLAESTLVIFSSDNGGVGGYAREGLLKANSITDNAPLRGGKGMLYEGGIRVPYIFRWQGKIAPGTVCDQPINSVDLYPTLLAVAGAKAPDQYPLDGVSYLRVLTSGGKEQLDRQAIYWHFPGYLGAGPGGWRTTPAGAIRAGDWKLLEFFEDGRLELYNLKADIGEKQNLAAQMPDKVKDLHAQLVAWRKAIGAPMPTPNKSVGGREGKPETP